MKLPNEREDQVNFERLMLDGLSNLWKQKTEKKNYSETFLVSKQKFQIRKLLLIAYFPYFTCFILNVDKKMKSNILFLNKF